MSNRLKRYRQISILESFQFSKKAKTNSFIPNENINRQRELDIAPENTVKELSSVNMDDDISAAEAVENPSSLVLNTDKEIELDDKQRHMEKILPSSLDFDENTDTICCAAEDPSSLVLNTDMEIELDDKQRHMEKILPSSLDFDENNDTICCAAEDSVKVNSENDDAIQKMCIDSKSNEEDCSSNHNLQNSEDLFPDKSLSLEDYSVPSSSCSTELFVDTTPDNDSSEDTVILEEFNDSPELDKIPYLIRMPDCSLPLPKLEPLENHTILFNTHTQPGIAPHPYPSSYRDKWDSDHVRMPCSPLSKYPVADANEVKHIESRWNLICQSLRSEIVSSRDLEAAIMKYNSQYIDKWSFLGLHDFINRHLTENEREHFFDVILPVMIEMTLDLPHICTQPIPLLKKGKDYYLTMSQKQIGCLLLNAFFCTYPRRNLPRRRKKERWSCEYATYPDANFNRLFYGTKNGGIPSQNAEKLKCLFNYFRRITAEEPTGTVTFHRQSLQDEDLPGWQKSTQGLRAVVVKSSGLIETEGHGMLQADFANKFVGGGVIGGGCVQEEIRFIICPELIVSQIFTECLGDNEVLIVTGVEQYNKYSGYSDTFKWEGNFVDETPRDSWGRRYTQLVAMDAISFKNPYVQYKEMYIRRELNKAYCAFYQNALPIHLPAVATGNWGCGAFKGNPNLKFLIQLMAASEASRSLLYFTFGNIKLKKQLQDMYDFLSDKNLSVGDVWRLLMRYESNVSSNTKTKHPNLYDFIHAQFSTKENKRQHKEFALSDSDKIATQTLIKELTCDGSSTEYEDCT